MKSFRASRFARGSIVLASLAAFGSATLSVSAAGRVRHVSARNLASSYAAETLTNELRPNERSFLTKAVETSRQQMRLAEVGASQAQNSDVRSHAMQLVTDYRAMNDALDALIRRRGGIAGAPVGGTSETYQKLVERSGGNFDREFIRTVEKLTDDTLTLFEQIVSDSRDADVRELAASQLPVLRAHRSAVTELKKTLG